MTSRILGRLLAPPALLFLGAAGSAAQQPSSTAQAGPFARMVVIAPKPGQTAAFESGYQRHLEWHRENGDPWTWYGWSFVLGDRLGLFMDGTFGHSAAGLDAAIRPAEDAADNAKNVVPYADFLSHGVYEHLPALSRGAALPDATPFLALATYEIAPGREQEFEAVLAARAREAGGARYSWYRLRIGGDGPRYVLMRAVGSFGEGAALPDFFSSAARGASRASTPPPGMILGMSSELLRYRPTLSYHPEATVSRP